MCCCCCWKMQSDGIFGYAALKVVDCHQGGLEICEHMTRHDSHSGQRHWGRCALCIKAPTVVSSTSTPHKALRQQSRKVVRRPGSEITQGMWFTSCKHQDTDCYYESHAFHSGTCATAFSINNELQHWKLHLIPLS